jgi:hypothetical protein
VELSWWNDLHWKARWVGESVEWELAAKKVSAPVRHPQAWAARRWLHSCSRTARAWPPAGGLPAAKQRCVWIQPLIFSNFPNHVLFFRPQILGCSLIARWIAYKFILQFYEFEQSWVYNIE